MSFTEEAQSIRNDAVTALDDYMKDIVDAQDLGTLYTAIEALIAEGEEQMDLIDDQQAKEEGFEDE